MNPSDFERFHVERGGVPASAHRPDCKGSPVILTSYPPQDGGVIGCTCGADNKDKRRGTA